MNNNDLGEQLSRCENDKEGWIHRHNLIAQELRVVKAALSFDSTVDRDLETCARRHFHGHTDALALVEKLTHEAVGLTFAVAQWREKAEAMQAPKVKAQGALEP